MMNAQQMAKIIAAENALEVANREVQRLRAINPIDGAIVPVLDQRSQAIRLI